MRTGWLYPIAGHPLDRILRWLLDLDVRGIEHLPTAGPFLMASNHISHLDPLVLCQVAWERPPRTMLRFLAKSELFDRQPLAGFLRACGQIPVARGTTSASESLVHGREALERGDAVAVFPEGTISPTLLPMRPYSGVGRLALDSGAPVIPVGMWGAHRSMTKYRRRDLRAHRPVTIDIGPPRTYDRSDGSSDAVARALMADIVELVDSARARYPEAPKPSDWWGPPEWPIERAGWWRVRSRKELSPQQALATARQAMYKGLGNPAYRAARHVGAQPPGERSGT